MELDAHVGEPLPVSDNEICGENGVLRSCIRQFLRDVPNADIEALTVDLRSNHVIWGEFKKRMAETVCSLPGVLHNSELNDTSIRETYRAVLVGSREVETLRKNVEEWVGNKVKYVTPSTEIMFRREFAYKNWVDLVNASAFGFYQNPTVTFNFEVAPQLQGPTFEVSIDPQVWEIPTAKGRTTVAFTLKITNTSDRAGRIGNWMNMSPILKKGGVPLDDVDGSDGNPLPTIKNYPVIQPKTSILIKKSGDLFWEKGQLTFCFWDGGEFHYYYDIRLGSYLFAVRYEMSPPDRPGFVKEALGDKENEVWFGTVTSDFRPFEIR